MEVLLECRKVKCERIAKLISKLDKGFTREFKVWHQNRKVKAYFKIANIQELNRLIKKLKSRKISFEFKSIRKKAYYPKRSYRSYG